jgi:hypothetical protein
MRQKPAVTRHGQIVRSNIWHGVRDGDPVVVNAPKERRQHFTSAKPRGAVFDLI